MASSTKNKIKPKKYQKKYDPDEKEIKKRGRKPKNSKTVEQSNSNDNKIEENNVSKKNIKTPTYNFDRKKIQIVLDNKKEINKIKLPPIYVKLQ